VLDSTSIQILDALRSASGTSTSIQNLRIMLRDVEMNAFIGRSSGAGVALGVRQPVVLSESNLMTDSASLTFSNAVTIPGDAPVGPFMILTLEADSPELEAYVAATFEGLLAYAQVDWSACLAASVAAIDAYQHRRQALSTVDEQVGLFGELLVIALASHTDQAIDAWHESKYAAHDFSIGQKRLEVKSSTTPTRLHWISQAQVMPSGGEVVTFASLYVPPTTNGESVKDLAEEIAARASVSTRNTFARKFEATCPTGPLIEFDRSTSEQSLQLVPSRLVPRPFVADPRITSVKWRVGLTALGLPTESELTPWDGLLRAY